MIYAKCDHCETSISLEPPVIQSEPYAPVLAPLRVHNLDTPDGRKHICLACLPLWQRHVRAFFR